MAAELLLWAGLPLPADARYVVNPVQRLDEFLLLEVNGFARSTGWLQTPLVNFAKYGVVLFGVLLLVGVFLARAGRTRTLAAAGWAWVAVLLALVINQPVGRLFGEARPYTTHPQLLVLASRTADFSFPSDHAVMAGAVASGLLLVRRRLGLLAVAAALLMAFARVYIAAHYPWDVLAGLLLGAGVSMLGWLLFAGPLTTFTGWLRRQPPLRAVFGDRAAPAGSTAAPAAQTGDA
jgi:membrane-associated phospholipid phosphatase